MSERRAAAAAAAFDYRKEPAERSGGEKENSAGLRQKGTFSD